LTKQDSNMPGDENRQNARTNPETGPWDTALAQLREWDPAWAESCVQMTTSPWCRGILPRKLVELIGVMLNAQCTSLTPDGTRRHIRAALDAGASRDEILFVLECGALGAIHSCSLGAPILMEEARAAGAELPVGPAPGSTPFCDRMKSIGQWNAAWNSFYELDPVWTDQFFSAAVPVYARGILPPKDLELLMIAFDASYTHLYAPGTRRHIKAALAAGATVAEIMEVLKLCVVQGVQSCNMGVPILAEELSRAGCAS
jgi:alkylhydroperoxidase/carboxymuconolactone decarboxylase family protein YurZ